MALNFLPGMQKSSLFGTGDFNSSTSGTNASAAESSSGAKDGKVVKSDPLTAIATSLFGGGGGGGKGDMPGLDYMGDFDPESFVSSTLGKARTGSGGGGGGGGFTELLGSLLKLI